MKITFILLVELVTQCASMTKNSVSSFRERKEYSDVKKQTNESSDYDDNYLTARLGAMSLNIYPTSELDNSDAVQILDKVRSIIAPSLEEVYSNFDSINNFELYHVEFNNPSRHRRRTLASHGTKLRNDNERSLEQQIKSSTIVYVEDVEMNFSGYDKPSDNELKNHVDDAIDERKNEIIDTLRSLGFDDNSQLKIEWVAKLPNIIEKPDPDPMMNDPFPQMDSNSNSARKLKIIVPLAGVALLSFLTAFFLSNRQKRSLAVNSLRVHDERSSELHGLDYIYSQYRVESGGQEENKAYHSDGFPILMRDADENEKETTLYRKLYELEDQGIEITLSENGDTVSSLDAEEINVVIPLPPYLKNLFDEGDKKNRSFEGKEKNMFEVRTFTGMFLGDLPNQQSSDSLRYSSSSLQTSRESDNEDSKCEVNDSPVNTSVEKTSSNDSLEDLFKYEEDSTFRDLMTKE
jgi:hypothetical protein